MVITKKILLQCILGVSKDYDVKKNLPKILLHIQDTQVHEYEYLPPTSSTYLHNTSTSAQISTLKTMSAYDKNYIFAKHNYMCTNINTPKYQALNVQL